MIAIVFLVVEKKEEKEEEKKVEQKKSQSPEKGEAPKFVEVYAEKVTWSFSFIYSAETMHQFYNMLSN